MHELSIALSIVEMGTEEAVRRGVDISAVHLRLGPLSGVVKEALLSCYSMACEGTALEGSELIIEDISIVGYCSNCCAERAIESIQNICCPVCGAPTPELSQGRELEVAALQVRQ